MHWIDTKRFRFSLEKSLFHHFWLQTTTNFHKFSLLLSVCLSVYLLTSVSVVIEYIKQFYTLKKLFRLSVYLFICLYNCINNNYVIWRLALCTVSRNGILLNSVQQQHKTTTTTTTSSTTTTKQQQRHCKRTIGITSFNGCSLQRIKV